MIIVIDYLSILDVLDCFFDAIVMRLALFSGIAREICILSHKEAVQYVGVFK